LELAMRAIAREKSGLLIYEQQEGRGIGLMAKLQAYSLQDTGLDTIEANHALGFSTDCRDFTLPVAILRDLAITRVRVLSNNPHKSRALIDAGIEVVEQVPCEVAPNPHSFAYLQAKKQKMGHALGQSDRNDRIRKTRAGDPDRRSIIRSTVTPEQCYFENIEVALRDLRAGRMIVVVDDEDREDEGDLVMAAELITPAAINFMVTHGRGLVCLAMTGERLDELRLAQMVVNNTSLGGTGFTVSIDAKGRGVTTGVSASDRAQTIRAAIDPQSDPDDFARPGHVFPLRGCAGGVLERRGHTEAAVDLARLAGLHPSGVICEILGDDGTMARVPDLVPFCRLHELKMITIEELTQYRLAHDSDGSASRANRVLGIAASEESAAT
jgi:3,4-dihydroxy-2-butanone 4-phosphate synthase